MDGPSKRTKVDAAPLPLVADNRLFVIAVVGDRFCLKATSISTTFADGPNGLPTWAGEKRSVKVDAVGAV